MSESRTPLPPMGSLSELVEFFDTHDMGEYWDDLPPANFDVELKTRRHLFAIDEELVPKVVDLARSRNCSPQSLINDWVREKVAS